MFTRSIRFVVTLLIVGLSLVGAQPASAQSTTADVVYGQLGSFTTNTPNNGGISANSLMGPARVVLDSSGNLYVADYYNSRVLFYPSGSTTATRVYGQGGSFTTGNANNGGISANSLYYPEGVGLDSSSNLYVADTENSRVLMYPPTTTGVGPPTNKDQCKNGGWEIFTIPRKFKNQGDCVSFVNTGK
jgi:NHL repeat